MSANATSPAASQADDWLSPEDESRAFWRLRGRLVRTSLRQMAATARFRGTLVAVLSVLLWLGLYLLLADGLAFLRATVVVQEIYDQTTSAILGMFFLTLLVMLVFSSGVILYGALFRSPETAFLLTCPVRVERVFLHKFQEAVLFSSWGFVLLGSPLLVAYGVVSSAPWYYYAMLLPFVLAFVYLPAALGAIACLIIMDRLPGSRVKAAVVAAAVIVALGAWRGWSLLSGTQSDLLTPGWFQEMLGRLQLTQGKILPSWWLSAGLLSAAGGEWDESIKFLTVLIANALFFRQMAIWVAGRTLRRAYSRLSRFARARRIANSPWIDRAASWLLGGLPVTTRLLIIKDFRTFRRDPLQWSQFLIFFGLLTLYFINIRRFSYDISYLGWLNMVSFLNVTVVGLLMSTFTTRFVYPMISLEGRRFWLLGLMPISRAHVLWSKFAFAVVSSILPCAALIAISDLMLGVGEVIIASHQLTCAVLCVGLSGIAVGLGARLPNLRESSPSRIAAGFGGTLNLVVSALYIIAVVMLTAAPAHFYVSGPRSPAVWFIGDAARANWWVTVAFFVGSVLSVVVGAAAAIVPMAIGIRFFKRLDL